MSVIWIALAVAGLVFAAALALGLCRAAAALDDLTDVLNEEDVEEITKPVGNIVVLRGGQE